MCVHTLATWKSNLNLGDWKNKSKNCGTVTEKFSDMLSSLIPTLDVWCCLWWLSMRGSWSSLRRTARNTQRNAVSTADTQPQTEIIPASSSQHSFQSSPQSSILDGRLLLLHWSNMVSRLFSTAGSLISQVGEVLAPQVHTPLEDLRDHWKAVRKFYIDENGILFMFHYLLFLYKNIFILYLILYRKWCGSISIITIAWTPCINGFYSCRGRGYFRGYRPMCRVFSATKDIGNTLFASWKRCMC